jgi:hypothetical protein
MDINQERRIHRLLLQREREFTAVWRAECEVNKILGADFPFVEPPVLPSSEKRAKKKTSIKRPVKPAKVNSLIRPLRDQENAYQLTYTCQGEDYTGLQNDPVFIRQLLPLRTESFAIQSVATVILSSEEDFTLSEELWNSTIPFSV